MQYAHYRVFVKECTFWNLNFSKDIWSNESYFKLLRILNTGLLDMSNSIYMIFRCDPAEHLESNKGILAVLLVLVLWQGVPYSLISRSVEKWRGDSFFVNF